MKKEHDTIKGMFSYIRMWILVRTISKACIHKSAMNRSLPDFLTAQGYKASFLDLEKFLEERSKNYLFGLLSNKQREIRKEKDRTLLQKASSLNYIEITSIPSFGIVVHNLPEGYFFSKFSNGLNEFLGKYSPLKITIVSILVTLIAWEGWLAIKNWMISILF